MKPSLLPAPSLRAPTGKIAALPARLRDWVNQSLHDNVGYARISRQLARRGHPGVSKSSLSRWRRAGFQTWLSQQERLQAARLYGDAIVAILRKFKASPGQDLNDLNNRVTAAQIAELLAQFDAGNLQRALARKPEYFFRLARTVIAQRRESSRRRRLQLDSRRFTPPS